MTHTALPRDRSLTNGEIAGLVSLASAVLLAFVAVPLAALPLGLFLALCLCMPLFPTVPFFMPVVSRGPSTRKAVALTFDDGPDPATTPALLELLSAHGVRGTFFVTGKRAERYPHLVAAIVAGGHSVGNHSYDHSPLGMLKRGAFIRKEIEATQSVLSDSGVRPLAFRPPAGITTPRLRQALLDSCMFTVNFSCRAFDGGNRWVDRIAERILRRVGPGDIILLHDIPPQKNRPVRDWLEQVAEVLDGLRVRGLEVMPLSELIGMPVMEKLKDVRTNGRPSAPAS